MSRKNILKAKVAFATMRLEFNSATTPHMLDKIAQRINTNAKKRSPVRTGALRASGRVMRVNQYRRRVQFGGSGTGVDYAEAVEYGTMNTAPRPFLEPAVREVMKQQPAIVKPSLIKWLQNLVRMGESKK